MTFGAFAEGVAELLRVSMAAGGRVPRSWPNSMHGCAASARLLRSSAVAEPIDYLLRRWEALTFFLDNGCVCLTSNAAERMLRGFALERKAWLFAGSKRGAERAAAMATLIETNKLNALDPQA